MNRIFLKLFLIFLVVLFSVNLTACKPTDSALEQAKKQLEEKGTTFVDTIDQASQLVDFPLVAPSYIPDAFGFMHIMVEKIGAGLPNPPEHPVYIVSVFYTQRQDFTLPTQYWFSLTQGLNDLSSSGTATEICGKPGTRQFIPADEANKMSGRLFLSWNDGSIYYGLVGTLGELLDEAAMEKIACSIINK